MKFRLLSRTDKKRAEVKKEPVLNEREKRAVLFLRKAVFHVFQRAGALEGLTDQEKDFLITNYVTLTSKGLGGVNGYVSLNQAKSLAKAVVKELQEEYGTKLKYHLLEQEGEVQAVIASCLRRHIRKLFTESASKPPKDEWLDIVLFAICWINIGVALTFAILMLV